MELTAHLSDELAFDTFDCERPLLGPVKWIGREISERAQRESLRTALASARIYAENPQGWVLLTGTVGAGKTHLAASIFRAVSERGATALYVSAPTLQRRYRTAEDPRWIDEREILKTASLLIIDDLDIGTGLIWNNYFDFVLRERKKHARPTVLVQGPGKEELPDWTRGDLKEIFVLAGSYRQLPPLTPNS